jgi:hypothetical protein
MSLPEEAMGKELKKLDRLNVAIDSQNPRLCQLAMSYSTSGSSRGQKWMRSFAVISQHEGKAYSNKP